MIHFLSIILAVMSLGDYWDFKFFEDKSIEQTFNQNFIAEEKMSVPGCWDVLPKYYLKRGTALYRRTFTVEKDYKNAVLEVEGMGLRGKFVIDGRDLGEYPYPYAKLEIPVGALKKGEHTIVAALDNRFDPQTMKLAKPFYDFYFFGGFYRGVRIVENQPKIFVRTLDYKTGEVEIEIEGVKKYVQRIKDFKLWSPDHPNMTTIDVDGRKVKCGIRQIEARHGKLYLNGQELFLKGVNRHDQSPQFGAAVPELQWLIDLQNLKALGGNFIRGAHYQQADRFLELCDEMGVLVWEESLGWGNGNHRRDILKEGEEFRDKEFCEQQIKQTRDMVRASFNHPSVIIYGFLNEPRSRLPECKALVDTLIKTIKAENSGRLVTFACNDWKEDICNENTDIIAFNAYPGTIPMYPGTKSQLKKQVENTFNDVVKLFRGRYPDKPIMVSESGCVGVYGWHDADASIATEDFQDEYLEDILDVLWKNRDVVGFSIWQMNDNRTYSRNSTEYVGKPYMGHSVAGIFNLYRQPKKSVATVKKYFNLK